MFGGSRLQLTLIFLIKSSGICSTRDEVIDYDFEELAALPEYQTLNILVGSKPLRFYFAPWHELGPTAFAFASTVQAASGGTVVANCDESSEDKLACLSAPIRSAMESMLLCSRDYTRSGAKPQLSQPGLFECRERVVAMEAKIEADAVHQIRAMGAEGYTVAQPPSLAHFLEKLDLGLYLEAFESAHITAAEVPLLTETHLRGDLGIPLGPALRILEHARKGLMARANSPLTPRGQEGFDWARVPCVPPYCWHRCEPRAQQRHRERLAYLQTEGADESFDEFELAEDDPKWRPASRVCPVAGRPSAGGSSFEIIHPISIGIPEGAVVGCIPRKFSDFAEQPLRDGPRGSAGVPYEFGPLEEHEYRRSYQTARFALTKRKAGWDCMRHYEILAAGAVPLFLGIEAAPRGSLGLLPRKMLQEALALPGLEMCSLGDGSVGLDNSTFDEDAYISLAYRLLDFTKRHLTTAAIARYVLDTVRRHGGPERPSSVLVLSANGGEDYVRDMLVHGIRSLGLRVVDTLRPRHIYESNVTRREELGLYGNGFTYSGWLPLEDSGSPPEVGHEVGPEAEAVSLLEAIRTRAFDLVVFGSVHRGLPFLRTVTTAYKKEEIIFIDGEDEHGWGASTADLMAKGHFFMREIPGGCPPAQPAN
mmetsp:Transcript_17263/g.39784  ORF Transcript_17263/g.39784 Transcript_17263/m.39784 type:complete len:650 (+) Transcript_17263:88-2037(+)